ncbi:MAG: transposase [Verrucomicrobiales bacterium]
MKSAARGFRSFANYRIRIMFFCAKLDLFPLDSCHENP